MFLLNFSHPLTADQLALIEKISVKSMEEVREIPTQFDNDQPLVPQTVALADACGLSQRDRNKTTSYGEI